MVFKKIFIASMILFLVSESQIFSQSKVCILLNDGVSINCIDNFGKQGLWRFFKGKKLEAEINYKNNLKFGPAIIYYKNNSQIREIYRNDTITDSSFYYINNKLRECKIFDDKTGTLKKSITYYPDSTPEYITIYKTHDDKLYPITDSFYKNGNYRVKNIILDSLGHTNTKFYKKNGEVR